LISPSVFVRRVAASLGALALGLAASHPTLAGPAPAEARPPVALDAAAIHDLEKLNDDSNWIGLEGLAGRLVAGIEARAHTPEELAAALTWLAMAKQGNGRYAEAEGLFRRGLTLRERAEGPDHPRTAESLRKLAWLFDYEGRYAEAEPILRRSLAIREAAFGRDHPNTAKDLRYLASSLSGQKRYGDAEGLLSRAASIDIAAVGPGHPDALRAGEELGEVRRALSRPADAVDGLRPVGAAEAARAGADGGGSAATRAPGESANRCAGILGLALWEWSAAGGGTRALDRPDALLPEAFLSAQRSLQSAAGEALARSAALTAAEAAGVGPTARAYEAALGERDALQQAYRKAAGESGEAAATRRRNIGEALDASVRRMRCDFEAAPRI
jgi:tetratricopeptide (TPR) repeat protein